jgi:hypothetical protein
MKNRSSFIQEVIHAEFDTTFYYPSEGTIVVIYDVVDEERIVQLKGGGNWGLKLSGLKSRPDLLHRHRFILKLTLNTLSEATINAYTVLGFRMVRQSRFQDRKKASGNVSCRCSTSSNGSSSCMTA